MASSNSSMIWMVVEDDAAIRDVIEMMCELLGFRCITFRDGFEAMSYLNQTSALSIIPDAALLDIRMPGPWGHEISAAIRRHPVLSNIGIILMTAYELPSSDEERYLQTSGADRLLFKPLPPMDELMVFVREAVRARRVQHTEGAFDVQRRDSLLFDAMPKRKEFSIGKKSSKSWNNFNVIERIGIVFLLGGIALAVIGSIYSHLDALSAFQTFFPNISTDLISTALTILIIDRLVDMKQQQSEKAQLIRQMGSADNATALNAIRELRERRMLHDGTLAGVNLQNANLRNAELQGANLRGANLQNVDLSQADLREAILSDSILLNAKLHSANLFAASLKHASLFKADLQEADLLETDLTDAHLVRTNFKDARNLSIKQLALAQWLNNAILVDGKVYDGRLRLDGDVAAALKMGVLPHHNENMANFYGVSVDEYINGQRNLLGSVQPDSNTNQGRV